jgi:hypothetical protein
MTKVMQRKLGHRYRICLAVASALLAVGLLALQFHTFWTGYIVSYGFGGQGGSPPRQLNLFAMRGTLYAGRDFLFSPDPGWHGHRFRPYELGNKLLGFVWSNETLYDVVGVPFWFLSCVAGFLAWRLWKGREAVGNVCRQCGYDLRATPERCPECGMTPPAPAPAPAPARESAKPTAA